MKSLFPWLLVVVVGALVPTACTEPPAEGEGEGDIGEGEGDVGEGEGDVGEGEGDVGEGEGDGPVVAGDFVFDGASRISGEFAFHDATGELFVVGRQGNTATSVAQNVAAAEYSGDSLVAFHTVVADIAASAERRLGTAPMTALGVNVKVKTLDASDDGQHLYWESQTDSAAGLEDLMLDDQVAIADAKKEKHRFTANSSFLIIGANVPVGAGTDKTVRTFAVGGGAAHVIAVDNTSNETGATRSGDRVIYGDNEAGNLVDITIQPIGGGTATVLAFGADDTAFKTTVNDSELVYLTDTLTTGDIEAVGLNGLGRRTVRAGAGSPAQDLIAVTANRVVYAAPDATSLRIIGLDGTGDLALGTAANSEGFSSDDRFFLFRDGVVAGVGTLRVFDTTTNTTTTLGAAVNEVAFASATVAVFDDAGSLKRADLTTGTVTVVDTEVDGFAVLRDTPNGTASQVAWRRADGIWRKPL